MVDYVKILKSGSPIVCTPYEATHILVDGELHPKEDAPKYMQNEEELIASILEEVQDD